MPRPPRLDLAGIPQHIVQRGVDRRPCFVLEIHYRQYLEHLLELSKRFDCEVHAYVLMCNHVHLLATPAESGGIGRLMQALGRRYVGFFNFSMGRTGTLWEGRFKSCLVDNDAYVMRCYRYIELNPVRAGITASAGEFRWTSFHRNGLGRADPLVTPHADYLGLGSNDSERAVAYASMLACGCAPSEADEIRLMTSRQRAFGNRHFQEELAARHERAMGFVKRGRPRSVLEDE